MEIVVDKLDPLCPLVREGFVGLGVGIDSVENNLLPLSGTEPCFLCSQINSLFAIPTKLYISDSVYKPPATFCLDYPPAPVSEKLPADEALCANDGRSVRTRSDVLMCYNGVCDTP